MWLYSLAAFLGAFLLFQVQMLFGKYILPWHGGVPAVWTTCMLFFQTALLAGYGWAHALAAHAGPRAQRNLHLTLLVSSLVLLASLAVVWGWPLLPDASWRPQAPASPVAHILLLLSVAIGLPFVTLAATAPLLQHWFSRMHRNRSPYRLYALSNAGSLAGLLSYPFAVEVFVPLRGQAVLWTAGYVLFAAVLVVLAWRAAHTPALPPAVSATDDVVPARSDRWLWFGLSACGSVLLLAITNQLSQEIAVVPFLWVLPLALYLLSFILCFGNVRWYPRNVYHALLVPALVLVTLAIQRGVEAPLLPEVLLYASALFILCMVCHGELARRRPAARQLTGYYLLISAGGAAGGVLVGIVAPWWFPGYWELSLGLIGCVLLVAFVLWRDTGSVLQRSPRATTVLWLASTLLVVFVFAEELAARPLWPLLAVVGLAAVALPASRWLRARPGRGRQAALATAVLVFAVVHVDFALEPLRAAVVLTRNFFGVQQVTAYTDRHDDILLRLTHGRTVHGVQYLARSRRHEPTGYYTAVSGVALALGGHPQRQAGRPLRVGVIGLGVGVLAAYGRPGDVFRFYEINPDIVQIASAPEALFRFLRDSPATIAIVPGDARLSLEHEPPQHYHLLVLDAFSSGSIPLHLLTREAFAVWLRHLDPQTGVLAVHISNRYLDLAPVLAALAQRLGLAFTLVDREDPDTGVDSRWLLLARQSALLPAVAVPPVTPARTVWTDDYSNLLAALARPHTAGATGTAALRQLDDDARLLDVMR